MLRVENISKTYEKKKRVLKTVSFEVHPGIICGLFGVNGAGKSTLLKILCGLEIADGGRMLFGGKEFVPGVYPSIGAMIEEPCFYPNMTGFDNLSLLSYLCDGLRKEDILKALDYVGLTSKKDVLFKKYSLGMKQRLYFASAIMRDADLLLLDEPFSGIDPLGLSNLESLIHDLAKKGKTIIISSHEIRELQVLVDKALFLDDGKIIFDSDDAKNIDIFAEFINRVQSKGEVQ